MNVSYDAENRQTAVGSNTYSYDGFGLRVGKTTANGSTVYVYDAFGLLAAEYGSATTASLCKTCYLSGDHLGSLRLVTDQNGSAIARHDYAPFGQEIPAGVGQRSSAWGASDNVNQKFTGQIRDSETNLDFFNARYMSSGLGRFASSDPANVGADPTDPQSWNGYGYVSGNPLNGLDPSGTDRMSCAGVQADACVTAFVDPVDLVGDLWFGGLFSGGAIELCPSCNFFIQGTTVAERNPPPVPNQFTLAYFGGGGLVNDLASKLATNSCPAATFKITGIAPGQAPGTTAISQTPRSGIPNGGVAIKPRNFGVSGINGSNRGVFLGMKFTVNWGTASPAGVPSGIPTQGPFFPVDNIGPASVRNSPGNAFDVYNYPSFGQALGSTRVASVTTSIPANKVGVTCPKAF
jgi:RHS repeat-associated protein